MEFTIGMQVVCVNDSNNRSLTKDKVYTIIELKIGCECIPLLIGIKVNSDYDSSVCFICGMRSPNHLFNSARFKPLDEFSDISELTNLLKETKLFEIKKL